MTTLRQRILEATPVGREFTVPELTSELFPEFKVGSEDWVAKRVKISVALNKEMKNWRRFEQIGVLPGSGRPIIWRRCNE